MSSKLLFGLINLAVWCACVLSFTCDQYKQVNSFIGTGGFAYGYGGVNPAAQVPHGALRLGPDTMSSVIDISFQHFSGYYYPDSTIRAFSHTHTVGAGVVDLGFIGGMPFKLARASLANEVESDLNPDLKSRFWWSTYNKTSEKASPGIYSVYLDKPGAQADLLAIGTHAAIHRYTWSADKDQSMIPGFALDMCHYATLDENVVYNSRCIQANLTVAENGQSFAGSVYVRGGLSGNIWIHIYGEIETNRANAQGIDWKMCSSFHKRCSSDLQGSSTSGIFFATATLGAHDTSVLSLDLELQVRVGISFINTDLAKLNLYDSLKGTKSLVAFDVLRQATIEAWCRALTPLTVVGLVGDDEIVPMLTSANYRSRLSPTIYTESGGLYFAVDQTVHNVTKERLEKYGDHQVASPVSYEFFSDFSFWDSFRTQHPWLLLLNEDLAVGIARSTAEITSLQGAFPRWMMANHEGSCMIGNSGSALVLEAIGSGLGQEFDVSVIQKALQLQSTKPVPLNGRSGVDFYMTHGYVSQEDNDAGASHTMTNAYDDFLLAGISNYVGATDDAAAARNRSKNYENVFSRDREFVCPRLASGEFKCADNPAQLIRTWPYFVEGDALHWTYFAPHDPVGLVSLFKSPQSFDAKLQEFFAKAEPFTEAIGNIAPNPYFWAGNEHDSFAPFMFNFGPNCTRTQYWSRKTTHLSFSNTPHGVPGNEDYGAMATWLLFASLGIFPQAGTTNFMVGSPRIDHASLQIKHYRGLTSTLEIITYDNSPTNVFVAKLLVNGQEYNKPVIDRSVLTAKGGCKLEFFMQSSPLSGLCPASI